jgi:hypothetical protein
MSMELVQLSPWGDAGFEEVRSEKVTFLGEKYSYRVLTLTPALIAKNLTERESETVASISTQSDPDPQDTTAPMLSTAFAAATGATTAEGSVDTDEADGVLYWVVTTSQAAPSPSQVKAGEDDSGGAAASAGAKLIGADGTQLVEADGLTSSTTYYIHYMHEDEAGGQSAVASSDSITTS